MKYEIIFYRSGKTAGLQLTIDKILNDAGFEIKNACAAADQKELGSCISAALKRSKLIIAVGQLNESDQSTEKLVSKLLVPMNVVYTFSRNLFLSSNLQTKR